MVQFIKYILVIIFIALAGQSFAEVNYIKSAQAKLTEAPLTTKAITVLTQGVAVEKLQEKNSWVQIKVNGKVGWVHKLALSATPPEKRVSLLSDDVDITSKARKRASGFTATGAARGLNTGSSRLADRVAPDFNTLTIVESRKVDPNEAVQFLTHRD